MVYNFSPALGKAGPELLEEPVAMAREAGILSVTFCKQTFAIYLPVFFALWMVFHLQPCPSASAHSSRPVSDITVDDNLASVFIFLSSADNDHGTKALEKLWEDEHRHT